MLVRFTAVGLIGVSVLELVLYTGVCFLHRQIPQVSHGLLLFIPLVLGIVVLVKAKAIAEWIANKFD